MGVSETIVAAMIGAMATVTTALFQLFGAIRGRSKADNSKPKRGMTLRSVLAMFALMVASAAGGFLYSELLKQRHSEDIRAMRQELKELKRELMQDLSAVAATRTSVTAQPTESRDSMVASVAAGLQPAHLGPARSSAESIAYMPACLAQDVGAQCEESDAQRIALCGTIPRHAQVREIELFVQPDAVQNPWEEHRVLFEQDLGGAMFTGKSFEYVQGTENKAVCVNFVHWSSEHPHIARLLVEYGFGPPEPAPLPDTSFDALEPTTLPPPGPAVIAGPIRE
ncbi:MAG: hypothetical protein GX535_04970 [Xanthomonadaceae bacterium]|nr:hypothetical protein [Xanthomonadaceae bacterium]